MSELMIPILVGGGIAYVAASQLTDDDIVVPQPRTLIAPTGSTVQQSIAANAPRLTQTIVSSGPQQGAPKSVTPSNMSGMFFPAMRNSAIPTLVQSSWGYNPNAVDAQLKEKAKQIEDYAEKTYNDMDEVGRAAAADKLNKELKLEPPLQGNESWKELSRIVGAAAVGAAGTALCGPVCGAAGAYVGAYLGGEFADWASENLDDLKGKLRNAYGDAKEWVSDKASDAYDAVAGLNPF